MTGTAGKTFRLLIFALFGVLLFACEEEDLNKSSEEDIRPLSDQELYLVHSSNELALDLLYDQPLSGNFALSPISTGMALGIIGNTGTDADFEDYKNQIGLPALNKIELNKAYYEISSMLPHFDENVKIKFANSIWSKYELFENEDFYTKTLAYYNADIYETRLEKEYDISLVNKWIQTQSDFSLHSIEKFDKNVNFQVVNTSLFTAHYFNETPASKIDTEFTSTNGHPVKIDMNVYKSKKVFTHHSSTGQSSFEIPLGDSKFILSIVIPEQNQLIQTPSGNGELIEYDYVVVPDILSNHEYLPGKRFSEIKAKQYLERSLLSHFSTEKFITPTSSFINKSYVSIGGLNAQYNSFIGEENVLNNANSLVINESFYYFIKEKNSDLILFEGRMDQPL